MQKNRLKAEPRNDPVKLWGDRGLSEPCKKSNYHFAKRAFHGSRAVPKEGSSPSKWATVQDD
jgi:hypothetical protein